MLKRVKIHDFRSCTDVSLDDIESLLVLIGRNGAGKSNILKAIDWAAKLASGNLKKSNVIFATTGSGSLTLEFSLNGSDYRYFVKVNDDFLSKKDAVFIEILEKNISSAWVEIINRNAETVTLGSAFGPIETSMLSIAAQTSCFVALQSILAEGSEFRILAEEITKFFSSVRYYPLDSRESQDSSFGSMTVLQDKEYKKWVADEFPENGDINTLLFKILHLKLTKDDRYDELQAILGSDNLALLDHIDIHSHAFGNSSKDDPQPLSVHLVWFYPLNQSGRFFTFNDLSFGTKRVISLVVAMLFDSTAISLIEQPEDGIHSGLVNKLAETLEAYSYNSQFIIASHSITLLNRLRPEVVRIVEMVRSITSVRALTDFEINAARQYLEKDGTFYEFLRTVQED